MKEVNKTTVIYLNKRKFGVTVSLNRRPPPPQHTHVINEKKSCTMLIVVGGNPHLGFSHISAFLKCGKISV